MTEKNIKRGLGRGLSALMADVTVADLSRSNRDGAGAVRVIPVEQLSANPDQPRKTFKPEDLQELADSIQAKGILQPLIVRQLGDGNFEIVAGERRWRAAQMAKVHELPVVVRDLDDAEVMEIAIIENIQRTDLNPLEEAEGFRQLVDRFGHTQEMIARALGKSRSHIANQLRLLSLPEDVRNLVKSEQLSVGHARALITSQNPSALAARVISDGLNVRETEALARSNAEQNASRKVASHRRKYEEKDADTRALEQDLSANLRMSVVIDHRPSEGGGQVIIRYKTLDDLDQLCQILSQVR